MDVVGREKHVEELLGFVKFPNMSLDFLIRIVAKEKLIKVSHSCIKCVFRAIGSISRDQQQKLYPPQAA